MARHIRGISSPPKRVTYTCECVCVSVVWVNKWVYVYRIIIYVWCVSRLDFYIRRTDRQTLTCVRVCYIDYYTIIHIHCSVVCLYIYIYIQPTKIIIIIIVLIIIYAWRATAAFRLSTCALSSTYNNNNKHILYYYYISSNSVLSVSEHVWPVSVGVLVERSQILEGRLIAELVLFLCAIENI